MSPDDDRLSARIAELIDLADQAGGGRVSWTEFIQELVQSVPGAVGSLVQNHKDGSRSALVQYGYDPECLVAYNDHFGIRNPWNGFWERAALNRVYRSTQTLPSQALRGTEFYHDWLSRLGGRFDGVGIKLRADNASPSIILHLPDTSLPEAEMIAESVLSRVGPAVARAVSQILLFEDDLHERLALTALLAREPDMAFVLDSRHNVVDINGLAEAGVREASFLRIQAGKLSIRDSRAQDWLRAATRSMLLRRPLHEDRHVVRTGGRTLRLSIFPITDERMKPGSGLAIFSLFLLLVRDLGRKIELEPETIGRSFALTAAEAKLCALLARGMSLYEAAERLCVTRETARDRLKTIFQKTGAKRQSELLALILRLT